MALDITRLSGGNTPADGSDPRTFPAIWNATSDALEALELDDLTGVTVTSPTTGQILEYNGSAWVNVDADEVMLAPGDNLIYNGAMQVAQRGTSETGITSSSYNTADRWRTVNTNAGTWTQSVEADAPTGSGFAKSLKVEVTTADDPLGATDQFAIEQKLEGQDLQGLKKGTSSAESLTLSFWVKSDVTGTYIARLFDQDNTRQIAKSYTISVADTWEKKTITFAGDTTGVFDNDNSNSLNVYLYLAAGSDYTSGTLATSWESYTAANTAVGQTNLAASTGNYWQVTGVQLETGEVASPFEHKPYGVELAECQRYYEQSYDVGTAAGALTTVGVYQAMLSSDGSGNTASHISFAVTKRTSPTVTLYSATGVQGDWLYFRSGATAETSASAPFLGQSRMRVNVGSIGASWVVAGVRGHFVADAEL